jgi:hypothetical protein
MASIAKREKGWRAQIAIKGVRKSDIHFDLINRLATALAKQIRPSIPLDVDL